MAVAALLAAVPCHASDTMDACVKSYEQAQRLRKDEDFIGSKSELLACLFPRCPQVLRRDCRRWMRELDASTPSFLIDGRDTSGQEAEIQVSLDGKPIEHVPGVPVLVNPGSHVFEVRAGSAPPTTYRVVARPGEKDRRLVVVIPPRVPREVWVLAGMGLAETGIAAYFFVRGHRAADDSDDGAVSVANTATGISIGMAALSFGAAGWLHWTRPGARWSEPTPATTAPNVGLRVRPDGSMLEVSGQF